MMTTTVVLVLVLVLVMVCHTFDNALVWYWVFDIVYEATILVPTAPRLIWHLVLWYLV